VKFRFFVADTVAGERSTLYSITFINKLIALRGDFPKLKVCFNSFAAKTLWCIILYGANFCGVSYFMEQISVESHTLLSKYLRGLILHGANTDKVPYPPPPRKDKLLKAIPQQIRNLIQNILRYEPGP
jgi:hypothetical protein